MTLEDYQNYIQEQLLLGNLTGHQILNLSQGRIQIDLTTDCILCKRPIWADEGNLDFRHYQLTEDVCGWAHIYCIEKEVVEKRKSIVATN